MKKIAIIGAGIAGLSAANLLKDNYDVTLFEKSRGVSGRMSTRRAEPYFFDHGAQYFTARTKLFQDFIEILLDQGIIERWNARYVKIKGNKIIERRSWGDEEPRYVGVPGMNYVGKFLAKELNIHINTKVVSLNYQDTWQLKDDQGQKYSGFDWVICTAPSQQTAELLPKTFKYHADIKAIEMTPCFSLMLGFKESLPIEFEASHVIDSDLSWISVNSHKPKRSNVFTLMANSSEKYTKEHIDDEPDKVMQHLITETSRIIGRDVSIADYKTIHSWRYANNADKNKKSPIFIDPDLKLAACGGWCCGGRVEGAFTSAYELTKYIKENIL